MFGWFKKKQKQKRELNLETEFAKQLVAFYYAQIAAFQMSDINSPYRFTYMDADKTTLGELMAHMSTEIEDLDEDISAQSIALPAGMTTEMMKQYVFARCARIANLAVMVAYRNGEHFENDVDNFGRLGKMPRRADGAASQ